MITRQMTIKASNDVGPPPGGVGAPHLREILDPPLYRMFKDSPNYI